MSSFAIYDVRCPECSHVQKAQLFHSVNGQRLGAAEDAIIEGRLHLVCCDRCGNEYLAERGVIYIHLAKKQLVAMYPRDQMQQFRYLEDHVASVFQREFVQMAPNTVSRAAEQLTSRLVFGSRQFAERLRVFRLGIDDRLLECTKLWLIKQRLADLIELGSVELCLDDRRDDTLLFSVLNLDSGTDVKQMTAPAKILSFLDQKRDDFERA